VNPIFALIAVIAAALTIARAAHAIAQLARARVRLRKRLAMGSPTLADGALVTVTGTVQLLGKPLIAPLSGNPCVAHQSRARVYDASSGPKQLIDEQVRHGLTPFVLVTQSGEIVVAGTAADLAIRPSPVIPRRMERERAFLREVGHHDDIMRASFDEVLVAEGMKITVFGVSLVELTPGESHYRETASRMRLTGDESHPLTIREP
jgi:hypothetical protein